MADHKIAMSVATKDSETDMSFKTVTGKELKIVENNKALNLANLEQAMSENNKKFKDYVDAIKIPTKVSELTNDKGYLTNFTETDPTVPAWAKAEQKPKYTASEVGADAAGTASSKVSAHNTSTTAHNDIRLLIEGITTRLNAALNSEDVDLDQMAEIVAYIKSNRSIIEAITTSKVSVTDIVNDLETDLANRPLSAAQGVAIKNLLEDLRTQLDTKETVYAALSEINLSDADFADKDFDAILHAIYKAFVSMGDKTANVLKIYASTNTNPNFLKAINAKLNSDYESTSYTMARNVAISRNNNNLTVVVDTSGTTSNDKQITCLAYANNSSITVTKFSDTYVEGGFFSTRNPVKLDDNSHVTGSLPISKGGTGATTAADALTALGAADSATRNVLSYVSLEQIGIADSELSPTDHNNNFLAIYKKMADNSELRLYVDSAINPNLFECINKKLTTDDPRAFDTVQYSAPRTLQFFKQKNVLAIEATTNNSDYYYMQYSCSAFINTTGTTIKVSPFVISKNSTGFFSKQNKVDLTADASHVVGVLPVANGGTGASTAKDALNGLIAALGIGDTIPTDEDYYISQKVGGGDTQSYYRRPMKFLWNYISNKISTAHPALQYLSNVTSDIQSQLQNKLDIKKFSTLSQGADLNTYKDPGAWIAVAATTPTLVNCPVTASSGVKLFIIPGYAEERCHQFLFRATGGGYIYFRTFEPLSDTWTKWYNLCVPSLTDLGIDATKDELNYVKGVTSNIQTQLNTLNEHLTSDHAPSDAEKNQNAFGKVVVGSTDIPASNVTDVLTLTAGGNVTLTPDATNRKVTIAAKDTTYSTFVKSGSSAAAGLVPKPSTTAGTTKYLREDGTWAVPPDTNTVYTHPAYTTKSSGLYKITVDATGHVSGATAATKADITGLGIPAQDTTYSTMTAATASAAGTSGLVPAPAAGKQASFLRGDGTWVVPTNTTYSNFVKSGSSAKAGLVPAPSTTAGTTKYLREDGTWAVPPDTNTTYTAATATPLIAGTAAVGTSSKYAREDHVHPEQTDITGNAKNVTGVVAIANGGTGKTTAKEAVNALFAGVPTGTSTGKNWTDEMRFIAENIAGDGTYYTRTMSDLWVYIKKKIVSDTDGPVMTGASSSAAGVTGLVPAPEAGKQGAFLKGDGTWATPTNTTYSNFVKSGSGAKAGLVPAPSTTAGTTKYLREDGTWATPPDTNTVYTHPSYTAKSSGLYKVTVDATGHVSAATAVAKADITGLGIPAQDTTYSVVSTTANGLAPKLAGGTTKFLRADGTWAVPPDTNTVYTHPAYTAKSSGLYKITVDATGHISAATAVAKADITGLGIPAQDTTYSAATTSAAGLLSADDKTKLDGIATGANKYTHPTTAGNKHIPTGGAAGQILKWSASGTAVWGDEKDTTYSTMGAATSSAAGTAGLVPAPAAGKQASFLRGDGTWVVPTNTTYSAATTSAAGLMSATDKTKLNGIEANANNYSLPTASSTLGGVKTTSTVTDASVYTACPIVDGVPYYKDTNTTYYMPVGTCTTAAATAAKTMSHSYYTLNSNKHFLMMFRYANTAASALTLNIASNGAKPIYINGAASSSTNYTIPAGVYMVYYDGVNYHIRTDGILPGVAESAVEAGHAESASAADTLTATLPVSKGGTGLTTLTSGYALIGNGTSNVSLRNITNITATSTTLTANTNLITANTLRYIVNRTSSVAAANTSYTTLMARGTSLNSSSTTPAVNGAIAWTYK